MKHLMWALFGHASLEHCKGMNRFKMNVPDLKIKGEGTIFSPYPSQADDLPWSHFDRVKKKVAAHYAPTSFMYQVGDLLKIGSSALFVSDHLLSILQRVDPGMEVRTFPCTTKPGKAKVREYTSFSLVRPTLDLMPYVDGDQSMSDSFAFYKAQGEENKPGEHPSPLITLNYTDLPKRLVGSIRAIPDYKSAKGRVASRWSCCLIVDATTMDEIVAAGCQGIVAIPIVDGNSLAAREGEALALRRRDLRQWLAPDELNYFDVPNAAYFTDYFNKHYAAGTWVCGGWK